MSPFPLHGVMPRFLALVQARAPSEAAALAIVQLELGHRPEHVIVDLLAAAQHEVGRRWHEAKWSVADEHQATAVTDAALYGVSAAAVAPRNTQGTAAVVCAFGDWHTLPARMAAEILRLDGWEVLFLGGSLPAADLTRWLSDARPDVLVVTCSIPTTAAGVVATAAAAADAGVPVVVGGRGMGEDNIRAAALGVRWAADLHMLGAALVGPAPIPDPADSASRMGEYTALELAHDGTVAGAMSELAHRWEPMSRLTPWQLARTREDFGHILDFLGAAVVTGDSRVFTDFVDWLTVLLTSRQLPANVVAVGLRALIAALPADLPRAGQLLTAAVDVAPANGV